ncbi:secreted protein [Rhodopirellula maiorica SM1]|uniref:Secreted protein n=1 Tax=Rhodopirellula maiorica SM1 TaxID=1265738 RepID=M5RPR1_9BACT|nr:secreted protein [Rhodopirellula maiorica SM1]
MKRSSKINTFYYRTAATWTGVASTDAASKNDHYFEFNAIDHRTERADPVRRGFIVAVFAASR